MEKCDKEISKRNSKNNTVKIEETENKKHKNIFKDIPTVRKDSKRESRFSIKEEEVLPMITSRADYGIVDEELRKSRSFCAGFQGFAEGNSGLKKLNEDNVIGKMELKESSIH